MSKRETHPIAALIRDLRKRAGLSVARLGANIGLAAVVVGSYERGDRRMTLDRADQILAQFDMRLAAVPVDLDVPAMLAELDRLYSLEAAMAQAITRHLGAGELHHLNGIRRVA